MYKAYSINDSTLDVGNDVEVIRDMYDRLKTIRTQINALKKSEFSYSADKSCESQE